MNICLLYVVVLFTTINSILAIKDLHYFEDELVNSVIQLIQNEDFNNKNVLVIYEEHLIIDNFFTEISKIETKVSLVTIKLNENQNVSIESTFLSEYNPNVILIFTRMNDAENVERIIFNLEIYPFWKIRSRFLLITYELNKNWIKDIFNSFWSRQIFYILITSWENEVKVYKYNPFTEKYTTDLFTNKTKLWPKLKNIHNHSIILYNFDNFFDGTIVKTSKNKYIGRDGFLYNTLNEYLNSSLHIYNLGDDFPLSMTNNIDVNTPLDDFFSALMEIYDFDALANCNGIFPESRFFDYVVQNERNDMFIILPKSGEIPKYLYIFLIIPFNVWVATFCSLVLVTVAIFGVRKYYNEKTKIGDALLDTYRLLLTSPLPTTSKTIQERILLITWIMYGIIFTILFQTILISDLMSTNHYKNIDNIEDLLKTDIKIYLSLYMRRMILNSAGDLNKNLAKHLISVPRNITIIGLTNEWLDNYIYRKEIGLIVFNEQIYYIKTKIDFANNWYIMPKSIFPQICGYYFRKTKLYYQEMIKVVGILEQSGIYTYQKEHNFGIDTNKNDEKNISKNSHDTNKSDEKPLTMGHLQLAFILLMFGYMVAVTAFFGEYIVFLSCNKIQ